MTAKRGPIRVGKQEFNNPWFAKQKGKRRKKNKASKKSRKGNR